MKNKRLKTSDEIISRYNEIMFIERDLICKYTYALTKFNNLDKVEFKYPISLAVEDGCVIDIKSVSLNGSKECPIRFNSNLNSYDYSDFYYGELSKIVFVLENMMEDNRSSILSKFGKETIDLEPKPFKCVLMNDITCDNFTIIPANKNLEIYKILYDVLANEHLFACKWVDSKGNNMYFTICDSNLPIEIIFELYDFLKNKRTIIDTYNGHNKKLVDAINNAFFDEKYDFADILFAIARRDREEIYKKTSIDIQSKDDAMTYAHDILENICDDNDLSLILSFIGYEN